MDRIRNRVMRTDFPKFFRKFIIVAVLAVIFSGAAAGIAFRAQIAEIVSYEKLTEVQDGRYDALDKGSKNPVSGHDMDKERGDWEDNIGRLKTSGITDPTAGAIIALCIFGLICLAASGVYWLTISAWLYQAAVRSGFHGFLWFLAALCGNLIAVILFVSVRSFLCEKCENCGKWQSRKNRYCICCGREMTVVCSYCKNLCAHGDAYCSACGGKLHNAEQND